MWITNTALFCCIVAVLAVSIIAEDSKEKKKDKDESRSKRNYQYSIAHVPYSLERRISTNHQLPFYSSQYFITPRSYSSLSGKNSHQYSINPPPYAVPMEPLVQYSQRDPLYESKLSYSTHDEPLAENNHISENIYKKSYHSRPPVAHVHHKHIIERPVYIKEPEPIIEIIIKESNTSLPPPPPPPSPPPKKKEQVQVFYVKYRKNPNGRGKDNIIYDKPIPALSPTIDNLEEEPEEPPKPHYESTTLLPPPSTTLRTIIKPDSEIYHSNSGIKVTFGKEGFDHEKRSSKPEDYKPDQLQTPQARQLSGFPNYFSAFNRQPSFSNNQPQNYRIEPRQPQPYRPFNQFKPPAPQPTQQYSTLPKFQPFPSSQLSKFPPRPLPLQYTNVQQRQPVPYKPFDNLRTPQIQNPSQIQFRPQSSFSQQLPSQQPPQNFNQFQQSRYQIPQQPQLQNSQDFIKQHQQHLPNNNFPQPNSLNIVPPGAELIQSLPKYEQHISLIQEGNTQHNQPNQQNQIKSISLTTNQPNTKQTNQISSSHHQQNYQSNQQQNHQSLYHQQHSHQMIQFPHSNNGQLISNQFNEQAQQFVLGQQQQQHNHHQQQQQQQQQQQKEKQQTPLFFTTTMFRTTSKPTTYSTQKPPTYSVSTKLTTTTTVTSTTPSPTTTKDPKILSAQLPDEVPEDLRKQLLDSGILNNADISILDYDKVGDIPLSALPPDQLANFYNAGGSHQLASSELKPSIVNKEGQPISVNNDDNNDNINDDEETEETEIHEVKSKPNNVQMKVVHYDPETDYGRKVQEIYLKNGAKHVEPVVLNDNKYNRYLPLKVSGTQFPIPDVEELKGKKISSVVVLAPITYDFSSQRKTRNTIRKEIEFIDGTLLKELIQNANRENFQKFLDNEKTISPDKQSVILLVTESGKNEKNKEIFMYDIFNESASKLNGKLSTAFVNAAEANAFEDVSDNSSSVGASSNIVETRIPYYNDYTNNNNQKDDETNNKSSSNYELDTSESEIVELKIPIIDTTINNDNKDDLITDGSDNIESFVDLSGMPINIDDLTASASENNNKNLLISTGYSKINTP